jgi:hypothetical protein
MNKSILNVDFLCKKGRYASLTEYAPEFYNLANTIDATNVSENATVGMNVTAKAENRTPNAPNLRCKLAEPAKVEFVIDMLP